MTTREINFDGLVGPTHNYAGLSPGNIASSKNARSVSRPKEAAHQGLEKMKKLADLGLLQGILPPQERPDVWTLRKLGYEGSDKEILERVGRESPMLLATCCSASSMWAANAATVSPSPDTADGRVHFTPANLVANFHRSIEAATTSRILRATFPDENRFAHHDPLPAIPIFGDEGAANHTRLCASHSDPGVELFVFGKYAFAESKPSHDTGDDPHAFPARQTYEASAAIARHHRLDPQRTVFARQNPDLIDQGVFHNDVIAVGNENVLLMHEMAFVNPARVIEQINKRMEGDLVVISVWSGQVSVADAVETYLFNSQLVTLPQGGMALIAPIECQEHEGIRQAIQSIVDDAANPLQNAVFMDVRQSMRNGGGPACLRLRVALNEQERTAINPGSMFSDDLFATLNDWVDRHYREELNIDELGNPKLLTESRDALDELTRIMNVGAIYDFQMR